MANIDLAAIQERVAQQTGNVNPGVSALLRPGAVFEIDDKLINFPNNTGRGPHEFRRVIVVQGDFYLGVGLPETALIVPCSASQPETTFGNFSIPSGEKAFTKPNVVAYTTLVMPVLKCHFEQKNHRGNLTPATLGALRARVAQVLGLEVTATLPPSK